MSKMSGVRCPHCDAPLEFDGSSHYVTCEYCGSNVEITGENEHVFRVIDEAAVQRTKTERVVRLKEIDARMTEEANDTEHQRSFRIIWAAVVIACLIAGLISGNYEFFYLAFAAAIVGFFGKSIKNYFRKMDEDNARIERVRQEKIAEGYIAFPEALEFRIFQTVSASAAVEILRTAGFENIQTVSLRDLNDGSQKKQKGIIYQVVINGKEANRNDVFLPDAIVQVQYHDYPEELASYITIPSDLVYAAIHTITYAAAGEMLRNAGFTNVQCVNLRDLHESSQKKRKDTVYQVIVDGNNAKADKLYPPDGKVQVQYHDFTEDYYNNPVRKAISAVSSKIGSKS